MSVFIVGLCRCKHMDGWFVYCISLLKISWGEFQHCSIYFRYTMPRSFTGKLNNKRIFSLVKPQFVSFIHFSFSRVFLSLKLGALHESTYCWYPRWPDMPGLVLLAGSCGLGSAAGCAASGVPGGTVCGTRRIARAEEEVWVVVEGIWGGTHNLAQWKLPA